MISAAGLGLQYVLDPVAVGTPLVEAPMQITQLVNVGDAAVSYWVDRHAIKSANESQGHGVSVSIFSALIVSSPAFRHSLEEHKAPILIENES